MNELRELLDRLWDDYASLNPQARAIRCLLEEEGEVVMNDHIALRTIRHDVVGIDALAAAFVRLGYEARGEYEFVEKKLFARHFEHHDRDIPKVFISELKLDECSVALGQAIGELIKQAPEDLPRRSDFVVSGRPWEVTYETYEALRAESEYAAWVAAFGFRANHFTVSVNALEKFTNLEALNARIKEAGYRLNERGGAIKGSAEQFLEQSSTMADVVEVEFADGTHSIPACYYEFAKRYPLPDGSLFQGFVAQSADKIFESTDKS